MNKMIPALSTINSSLHDLVQYIIAYRNGQIIVASDPVLLSCATTVNFHAEQNDRSTVRTLNR